MEIQWFGQGFIRLNIKSSQNGDHSLHINPYQVKKFGLRQPKMDASIILVSDGEFDKKLKYNNDFFLINGPGEYESKQNFIYGLAEVTKEDIPTGKTMFVIEAEGMTVGYLGEIKQSDFNEKQLEFLKNVDILILPVGGNEVLNAKQATIVTQQIEPRIIIPIYYNFPKSKLKFDKVDQFIKESGGIKSEAVEKLKIVKKHLPTDNTLIYILNI